GTLVVDHSRQTVIMDDRELLLTPTEIQFVTKLIESPGRIVSRREFAVAAWGDVSKVHGQSIDMHMQRLRKKLEAAFSAAISIDNVRGAGYRLQISFTADASFTADGPR